LSRAAFTAFRKLARESRRLDAEALREKTEGLLEKLNLVEGAYLKRAAVLLFHADPEKFVSGAFVKVGYFRSGADLLFHDEVRGDLFTQARVTLDLLVTKYLKASIAYSGLQRIESLPVPEEALREALLNALIHKDYASHSPIQIRVYPDKLQIWNSAVLPEGWTAEKLLADHSSHPFNPLVAAAFFRAGEIEAWGRGIQRIVEACEAAGTPSPVIRYDLNDYWFEFPFSAEYVAAVRPGGAVGAPVKTPGKTPVETPGKTEPAILALLRREPRMALSDVAARIGRSARAVERAAARLQERGQLRRVGPDKGGHWEVLS
jgi:ATP-dependent DNA helicase RecG